MIIALILAGASAGKEVAVGFAIGLALGFDTAVFASPVVQGDEPAFAILDKEGHIGQQIKQAEQLGTGDLAEEGVIGRRAHKNSMGEDNS
jgi:hypothetical protein